MGSQSVTDRQEHLATSEAEIYSGKPFAGTVFRIERKHGQEKKYLVDVIDQSDPVTLSEAKDRIAGFHGTLQLHTQTEEGEGLQLTINGGDERNDAPAEHDSKRDQIEEERQQIEEEKRKMRRERKMSRRIENLKAEIEDLEHENSRLRRKKRELYKDKVHPDVSELEQKVESLEDRNDELKEKKSELESKVSELEKDLIRAETEDSSALERGVTSVLENLGPHLSELFAGLSNGVPSNGSGHSRRSLASAGSGDSSSEDSPDRPQGQDEGVTDAGQQRPASADSTEQTQHDPMETTATTDEVQDNGDDDAGPVRLDKAETKRNVVVRIGNVLDSGDPSEAKEAAGEILETHRAHVASAQHFGERDQMMTSSDWTEVFERSIHEAVKRGHDVETARETLAPIVDQTFGEEGGFLVQALKAMDPKGAAKKLLERYDVDLTGREREFAVTLLSHLIEGL